MGAVINLDARPLAGVAERIGDGQEPGGEFLVRKPGHEDPAVDKCQVRDRFGTRIAWSFGTRRIGERGLREGDVLQRERLDLPRRINADDHRGRGGAFAARDGYVRLARGGVDRQVIDQDLVGGGADGLGNLAVDSFGFDGTLGGRTAIAGIDREAGAWPAVSPTKSIPSGPKASGPADLMSGVPFFRPSAAAGATVASAARAQARRLRVLAMSFPFPRWGPTTSGSETRPYCGRDVARDQHPVRRAVTRAPIVRKGCGEMSIESATSSTYPPLPDLVRAVPLMSTDTRDHAGSTGPGRSRPPAEDAAPCSGSAMEAQTMPFRPRRTPRGSRLAAIAATVLGLLTAARVRADVTPPGGDVLADLHYPTGSNYIAMPSWTTTSGWDVKEIVFTYYAKTDTLDVDVKTTGIAGDADGSGHPGGPDPRLTAAGGVNPANIGGRGSITIAFAEANANHSMGGGVAVAGVPEFKPAGAPNDGFMLAQYRQGSALPTSYGSPITTAVGTLLYNPSAAHPDFEFTIQNFSKLFGLNLANGFYFSGYAGSPDDVVVGEDNIGATFVSGFNPSPQTINPLSAGDFNPGPPPAPTPAPQFTHVPEPSSLVLCGLGAVGFWLGARRRKRTTA